MREGEVFTDDKLRADRMTRALSACESPFELLDISKDGQVWKCPFCGRHLSGESLDELDDGYSDPAIMHRHDCPWVAARRWTDDNPEEKTDE